MQKESDRQNIHATSVLLSTIDRYKDSLDDLGESLAAGVLRNPLFSFFQMYRKALEDFFEYSMKEAPIRCLTSSLEVEPWVLDALKNHNMIPNNEHKPYYLQEPVVSTEIDFDERLLRLKWLIKNSTPEQIWESFFSSDKFNWSIFHPILNSRSLIYDLKNSHHAGETKGSRNEKLIQAIISFVGKSDCSSMVFNLSKQIYVLERLVALPSALSLGDYSHFGSKIQISLRLGKSGDESAEVLARMEKLIWGPENYVRNAEVIEDAKNRLLAHGAIVLSSWGGAGKTALANKLTFDFAQKDAFQKYALFTTKIESNQKTLTLIEESASRVETTSEYNAYEPLRIKGEIAGSFRRVCIKIIQTDDPTLSPELKDKTDEELSKLALSALCNLNFLVVIDNFEDIENPDESYIEHSPTRAKINHQYSQFKKLIIKHCRNFLNNKSNSCFIVTTRGTPNFGHQITVELLDRGENYDLLRSVLLNRVRRGRLDYSILQSLSDLRPSVNDAFGSWIEKGSTEEFRAHPLNVIFAAQCITNHYDIVPQIRKWNPKNSTGGPEEIARYCTREMLNTTNQEERDLLLEAAKGGENNDFTFRDFMLMCDRLDLDWSYNDVRKFIDKYTEDRQWFVQHPSQDLYRWAYNIYLHLRTEYFPGQTPDTVSIVVTSPPYVNVKARDTLAKRVNSFSIKSDLMTPLREITSERNLPYDVYRSLFVFLHHADLSEVINFNFGGISVNQGMRQFLDHLALNQYREKGKDKPYKYRVYAEELTSTKEKTAKGNFLEKILPEVVNLYADCDSKSDELHKLRTSKTTYDDLFSKGIISEEIYLNLLRNLFSIVLSFKEKGNYSSETFDYLVLFDLLPSYLKRNSFFPEGSGFKLKTEFITKNTSVVWDIFRLYHSSWNNTLGNEELNSELFWLMLTLKQGIRSKIVNPPKELRHSINGVLSSYIFSLEEAAIHTWMKKTKKSREEVECFINSELFGSGEFDCIQIKDFDEYTEEPQHFKIHLMNGILEQSPQINERIICDFSGMESIESKIISMEMLYRITRRSGDMLFIRPIVSFDATTRKVEARVSVSPKLIHYIPHRQAEAPIIDNKMETDILRAALFQTKTEEIPYPTFLFRLRNQGVFLKKTKISKLKYIEKTFAEEMGFLINRNSSDPRWIEWLDLTVPE